MLSRHGGGDLVRPGAYVGLRTGELAVVEPPFGRLPSTGRHVRIPLAVAVAAAPLVGLVYVLSLPLALPVGLVGVLVSRWRGGPGRTADGRETWPRIAVDRA